MTAPFFTESGGLAVTPAELKCKRCGDRFLSSQQHECHGVFLPFDDAITAAVAIRESMLNPAMGYSHREHLREIAERLEEAS